MTATKRPTAPRRVPSGGLGMLGQLKRADRLKTGQTGRAGRAGLHDGDGVAHGPAKGLEPDDDPHRGLRLAVEPQVQLGRRCGVVVKEGSRNGRLVVKWSISGQMVD